MSTKPSGYGTMQIGGQERPWLVGLEQADTFCRLLSRRGEDGHPMTLKAYGELFSLTAIRDSKLLPSDIYDFIYSALVSGANEDGLHVDFTPRVVSQWLTKVDDEEAGKPIMEMLEQTKQRIERQLERQSKNASAPTTGAKSKTKKAAKN